MNERDIFTAAMNQADSACRAALLDEACAGDARLRQSVESLLAEHAQLGGFLETRPPAATSGRVSLEGPGTLIGPYKLLEQIGEGGMGLVYMAEQQRPLRRLVALKLIKPGMDSKQVIARFEAEKQALAMMDHEHIAKVFEAGTTDTGRFYFAMELVRGVPINEFCDQQRLSVRERLGLFIQVCQAVQHAHQKGIIHRDLKPSNVLVTMNDVLAVPKVIDFGIAKALGQQLTEHTLHTGFAQLVGTPLYMSPEQAQMNQLGVDTRSDVYSLGVLLYELLTGQTPFDKETLSKVGLDEMRRMIREDDPPRPSARISTLQAPTLSTISQRRSTDPRRISAALRGELDWIVMKAIEKDRSRRYESASALATDIQRFLSDEPVLACPPTAMYRFQKFARKHRPALATTAAIAVCLLLGTTVSAWQAVRATTAEEQASANETQAKQAAAAEAEQRKRAEDNEKKASAERDEAKTLADELRRTLYASNMNRAKSAWDQNAVGRVVQLLDEHRPKAGEADLRGFEWHYFNRLCHPATPLTLKLPNETISISYSPDGKRLASSTWGFWNNSGSTYPELKLWDTQTGKELFKLQGSDFETVAFSPDGKRLVSTTATAWDEKSRYFVMSEARVWDAETGAELLALKGHTGYVTTLAYSPDGKRIATGSEGRRANPDEIGELKIWDTAMGQELRSLSGNTNSLAFSPDGKRLACAMYGSTSEGKIDPPALNVFDVETGQRQLHLPGSVRKVAFSPNGKLLATEAWIRDAENATRRMGQVKVWDSVTGEEIRALSEKSDAGILFAFSPDSKRIATAGQRARVPRVKVCDTETGEELFTFQQHTDAVHALAFSADSKWLASGSRDQTLRIWDVTSGQEVRTLKGEEINDLAFSPDGKHLASGTGSGTVNIWDLQEPPSPKTFQIEGTQGVTSADFTQFASASRGMQSTVPDKSVSIWSADSGRSTQSLTGYANMIFSLAFGPRGDRLAVGEGNAPVAQPQNSVQIRIWDLKAGREILTLQGDDASGINSVAFSPDGTRLATSGRKPSGMELGYKSKVKMWDSQTGRELFSVDLVPKVRTYYWGTNVVFSPDGKRFASGVAPEVKIFSAEDGTELLTIPDGGRTVAFNSDGQRLASGSAGFKIWDSKTGQELLASRTKSPVTALAFSPDGKRVASTSSDGIVTLWDAHSGHPTVTFEYTGERAYGGAGMTKYSHNVAFSADGHQLCSVLWDGTVRIWDATPLPENP